MNYFCVKSLTSFSCRRLKKNRLDFIMCSRGLSFVHVCGGWIACLAFLPLQLRGRQSATSARKQVGPYHNVYTRVLNETWLWSFLLYFTRLCAARAVCKVFPSRARHREKIFREHKSVWLFLDIARVIIFAYSILDRSTPDCRRLNVRLTDK